MSKHTPGPWSIGYANIKDQAEVGIHGPGRYGYIICDMQADGYDEKTQDANARLISAAPCLLEALQAAIECGMIPSSSAKEGGAVRFSRQVHVADMIRAAIAKATGGDV